MVFTRALPASKTICRNHSTIAGLRPVPILRNASLETFQTDAFIPAIPALLPSNTFASIPAITRWFEIHKNGRASINRSYLSRYGSTIVPLEISNEGHFSRTEQSLSFFLECVHASSSKFDKHPSRYFSSYVPGARAVKKTKRSNNFFSASVLTKPTAKIYLAQASIADLPRGMKDDLPTPELVLKAGKGDVYDSSIWLGQAPTYTPLHKDPNPNLFVQLAGKKVVRLFPPEIGRAIFAKVQEKIGGMASESMRGDEMMQGAEKEALENEVWGKHDNNEFTNVAQHAELNAGDAIFIPKGWWHSIKSTGHGMVGSVC